MFAKLRRNVRDLGVGNTALYLVDRLLVTASGGRARLYKYHLVAQPLNASGVAPLRADAKLLIEEAHPGHALSGHFPRPAEVIRQRFEQGARCLVARSGDTFAGYLWWRNGHYEEDEVRCQFVLAEPNCSVWDFDVYVEPRYRLGRTMARLWDEATRRWYAKGARWSFSRISGFNASSMASHARLGLRPVGSAVFIVIGRWQLSMFSMQPFVHIGLAGHPVLRLHVPV